ncbi:MAG: 16S rRNA (cytosine(1402)-N(4))-methyltransferase [Nitrospiraceae bacterium]
MYTPTIEWVKVGEMEKQMSPALPMSQFSLKKYFFGLRCKPGGVYVDCTIGYAGLAIRILDQSAPSGVLVGIDRDRDALMRRVTDWRRLRVSCAVAPRKL